MNCRTLMALSGLCLLLSSCMNTQNGIFGRLPVIYEQTAARQRSLEEMLASRPDDSRVQEAMSQYMHTVEQLQKNVRAEAALLMGDTVAVSATPASGYKITAGRISAVRPGVVTTVEIQIPASETPPNDRNAYICFIDEEGEPVAKAEAWYDSDIKAIRLEVPFAINPEGKTVGEDAFAHYDRTMRLRLVSANEYSADSFEGEMPGVLLTVDQTQVPTDSAKNLDTIQLAVTDSVPTAEELPEEMHWDGPVLTSKGIGSVTLGSSLKAMPDHMPGVYDSKKLERQYDEMEEEPMLTASFLRDGKVVMTALGDEQGNMIFLTVELPGIKVNIDGHYFGVGDVLQPIYSLKGVVRDETGAFAATYHGISIAPTPGGLIHTISVGAVW